MTCEHQLELVNSWLNGPKIVCRSCGKRWDVRGKMLADACCWGLIIIVAGGLMPMFFGRAMQAFFSYGKGVGYLGSLLTLLIMSPCLIAVHFGVFALGHMVHAWCIRRSRDLQRWIVEDPYHP